MSMIDFIFKSLKSKLPGINWDAGSSMRELIAMPLAKATEITNTALSQQLNAYTVDSMVNEPLVYADNINEAFSALGLQNKELIEATGTVTITTDSAEPITVLAGTVLYYGSEPLVVSRTVRASINTDGSSEWVPLVQLLGNSYTFELPVRCTAYNKTLTVGAHVVWKEAPSAVYDIRVTSAVSGGRTVMSLQEKAQLIKDYVAPNLLTFDSGITKALRNGLPDIVVDAIFDKNINDAYRSYVYVKPSKAPGLYKVTAPVTIAENSASFILDDPGAVYIDSLIFNGVSYPIEQCTSRNGVFSCKTTISNDTGAAITSLPLEVNVFGFEQLTEVQDYLDNYLLGTPYRIKVIAPTPYTLELGFKYRGTELKGEDLNTLAEHVQFSVLDKRISDVEISYLLSDLGKTLVDSCTYTVTQYNGVCYRQMQQTPDVCSISKPAALYTGMNDIKAEYVQ